MTTSPTVYTAHDPADLAGALPTLFGFMPEHSVVAITTEGPRRRLAFRMRADLPPDLAGAGFLASQIARHVDTHGKDGLILMALGDTSEREAAEATMLDVAQQSRLEHVISLWIDTEAALVYVVGADVEPTTFRRNLEALSLAIGAGQQIVPSRAALVAAYEPALDALTVEVEEALAQLVPDTITGDEGVLALARMQGRGTPPNLAHHIAVLAVAVQDIEGRDKVWGTINVDNARELICGPLLVAATHTPADLRVPVYALLAFAEWQSGDGARALTAVDQVLAVDPDYSMARLILQVLEAGINPAQWKHIDA